MHVLFIVLSIVFAIACIGLIVIILMQSKRSAGLSGSIGGAGGSNDTYWSKNKGRSLEGTLETYTKIGGAILIILGLVLNFI